MIATAIKFFLYIGVMVAYSVMFPEKSTAFISNFFVIYILLTVFEVSVLYSHFRRKSTEK